MFKTKKIRVGISSYTLEEVETRDMPGRFGEVNHRTKTVKIQTDGDIVRQPNELLDTFVHEILHMVFIDRNMEDTLEISSECHEKIVMHLATGLASVLVDNPSVMKDITSLAAKTRRTLDI